VPNLARVGGTPPPEVDMLSRDLADLRQTEKKTQDTLEIVHGTLGHVVDRLAMIETDLRSKPAPHTDVAPASTRDPPVAAPAPKPPAPLAAAVVAAAALVAGKQPVAPEPAPKSAPSAAPTIPACRERAARAPAADRIHPCPTACEIRGVRGARSTRRAGTPSDRPDIAARSSARARFGRSAWPQCRLARRTASPPLKRRCQERAAGHTGPAGKSNFIAAARRAAQAAGPRRAREKATLPQRPTPPHRLTLPPRPARLASRVGKLRALIGGTTAIVLVLGTLQVVRMLGSSDEAEMPAPSAPTQVTARPRTALRSLPRLLPLSSGRRRARCALALCATASRPAVRRAPGGSTGRPSQRPHQAS